MPLAGGIQHGLPPDTNRINRVADQHGNLQRNVAALDVLESILTAKRVVRRDANATVELRVAVPELVLTGGDLSVAVTTVAVTTVAVTEDGTARQAIAVTVRDETGKVVASAVPRLPKGHAETTFTALPPAPTPWKSPGSPLTQALPPSALTSLSGLIPLSNRAGPRPRDAIAGGQW